MTYDWHIHDLKNIETKLNTNLADGLTSREAKSRLESLMSKKRGRISSLFVSDKRSALSCVISFFLSPPLLFLTVISVMIALFGKSVLGLSLLALSLIASFLGGFINLKATKRLEAMSEYASPMVKVRRGGTVYHTDGRNTVSGDLIILAKGDVLPFDARLIESNDLIVDEIYYEDKHICRRRVEKSHLASYLADETSAPDALNMLYAGSAVVGGTAVAVVTDIGDEVYLSEYIRPGALASNEGEVSAVTKLRPIVYKTIFIATALLVLLSLIGLLTLDNVDFIFVFTLLLSSVSMLTLELFMLMSKDVFASEIKRLSVFKTKKVDLTTDIRGLKSLDNLAGISHIAVIGGVGFSDGVAHVTEAYTSNGISDALSPDNILHARMLTCMHTYLKALRESCQENDFVADGYLDSLSAYLKASGFDTNANELAIKSLYFSTNGNASYACAETPTEVYRTALSFDKAMLYSCALIRCTDGLRSIDGNDNEKAAAFIDAQSNKGARSILILSENEHGTIFEGIIALSEGLSVTLNDTVQSFDKIGVKPVIFFPDEEVARRIVKSGALPENFLGCSITAAKFKKSGSTFEDLISDYSVFIGFNNQDYCMILDTMKRAEMSVAIYGVDNDFNEIMSHADIAVSCDPIKYSTERYKNAFYERMSPEGRDTNLRCSQQTRLLSRIIVKRDNARGGGLRSLLYAVMRTRSSYVSFTQSILLYVMLMTSLLGFASMTVITGLLMIDPLQSFALSIAFAFLSITAFKGADVKSSYISHRCNYNLMPISALKSNFIGIVARFALVFVFSIALKILDLLSVFGANASYTFPIYICIMLSIFAEVFMINRIYTDKGDGRRRCWMRVLIAYAFLMEVSALETQRFISGELYPSGFGSYEFLIVPAYAVLYGVMILITSIINKGKKTSM